MFPCNSAGNIKLDLVWITLENSVLEILPRLDQLFSAGHFSGKFCTLSTEKIVKCQRQPPPPPFQKNRKNCWNYLNALSLIDLWKTGGNVDRNWTVGRFPLLEI